MDLLDVENPIYESKSNQRRAVVVQPTNFGALESGGWTIETTPFKKYSEYKQIGDEKRFESQREPIRIPKLTVAEPIASTK